MNKEEMQKAKDKEIHTTAYDVMELAGHIIGQSVAELIKDSEMSPIAGMSMGMFASTVVADLINALTEEETIE